MNNIRKFYIKHPKFRKYFDRVGIFINWANIITYVFSFIILLIVIVSIYASLPDDIGASAATITGGLLSISVFPLIIESINNRTKIQSEHFNQSHEFYINLSKHIITALKTEEPDKIMKLSKFIEDNYPTICIDMPQKLNEYLLYLKEECDLKLSLNVNVNSDIDTIAYFAERCIKIIRKQGNVEGSFYFNRLLTKKEHGDNA